MELSKDKETIRMQVWLEAWTRTSQSNSCMEIHIPTSYADRCLKDFDDRFPIKKETE